MSATDIKTEVKPAPLTLPKLEMLAPEGVVCTDEYCEIPATSTK